MVIINKNDFVEIEYTGRTSEEEIVFDTTDEKVAKDNGIYDKNSSYKPIVICAGENQIIKGIDEQIIGKETDKAYKIELSPDNAFGKKDAKLIQLIPIKRFKEQNIQPVPGLQLNIDGIFGIVKTVSGGRCLVDFNNPLAGKSLYYDLKINRVVQDDREKLKSLLKNVLKINGAGIEIKENIAKISLKQEIPGQIVEEFKKLASRMIPSIKELHIANHKNGEEEKNQNPEF